MTAIVLMFVAVGLFGCCAQLHNIYDALVDLRRALAAREEANG